MKFIFFFLIALTFYTNAIAQVIDTLQYTVTYKATLQLDSLVDKKKSELMILQVGKKIDKFIGLSQERLDSVGRAVERGEAEGLDFGSIYKAIGSRPIEEYCIFKEKREKQYKYVESIIGIHRYVYKQPMQGLIQWRVLQDTATIAGYYCQKAICHFAGHHYVAWFTTQIPLKAAPYKFDGLPGVVVRVADTKEHYCFELIKLQEANLGYIYDKGQGLKEVSRSTFLKQREKITERNVYDLIIEGGTTIQASEEALAKLRRRKFTFRNNNPIELE